MTPAGGDVDDTCRMAGGPGCRGWGVPATRSRTFSGQDSRFVTVTALCAIAGSLRSKR